MLKFVRLSHPNEADIFVFTVAPLSHANLANAHRVFGYVPASAGFVNFIDGAAVTSGESISLNLKPDMSDARLIGAHYRAQAATAPLSPA